MISGTWMNQDSFIKLFQILGQQKTKKRKNSKKSKERLTVAFFVSSKACKPVVIRKSKIPRYF